MDQPDYRSVCRYTGQVLLERLGEDLDYGLMCTYVGQLFLETRHRIEQMEEQLSFEKHEKDEMTKRIKDLEVCIHAATPSGAPIISNNNL